jgi:hypothetical protein
VITETPQGPYVPVGNYRKMNEMKCHITEWFKCNQNIHQSLSIQMFQKVVPAYSTRNKNPENNNVLTFLYTLERNVKPHVLPI